MDFLRQSDLHQLLEVSATPCVSVFTPIQRAGKETQQNPVRLRNGLDEAQSRLTAAGMRRAEACELLKPGRDLQANASFWREQQGDGLALFLAAGVSRMFRLPISLPEMVVVSDRFHVRPLLTAVWPDHSYIVLALSPRDVRLLRCSRFDVRRVDLNGTPTSIEQITRFIDAERPRQPRVAAIADPAAETERLVVVAELKRRSETEQEMAEKINAVKGDVMSAISRVHAAGAASSFPVSQQRMALSSR